MLARSRIRPGFWLVFWREVGWLQRRPFLFALTTIVPLAQMAVLAAIFSAGLATRLPEFACHCAAPKVSRWNSPKRICSRYRFRPTRCSIRR